MMDSIGFWGRAAASAPRFRGKRLVAVSAFLCLLSGLSYGSASAQATAAGGSALQAGQAPGPNALVVLNCTDVGAMREVVAEIEALGGAVRHIFPPHVLIGKLPAAAAYVLARDSRVDLVTYQSLEPKAVRAGYGRAATDGVFVWNEVFAPGAPPPLPPTGVGKPLVGDVLFPPLPSRVRPLAAAPADAPPGAASWQTSEFMMGSVAVSVILPESNGAMEPSTENWDLARQATVAARIAAGLDWWASTYPYAVAQLSFTYDYHYGVPTSYEPISHPQTFEGTWIAEVMTALGHPATSSDYFTPIQDHDNDLRDSLHTDWAYTVFVADSLNDANGEFSDGYFAYAYFGGPFAVMTYDNDNWGISYMDSVIAHETAHIFYAGDEYCDPGYSCCDANEYDGYLNVKNSNCSTNTPCIMLDNKFIACFVTREQLGWRDSDVDGCPDILDVPPTPGLNLYTPNPTADSSPTYTGAASVGFLPNQNAVAPGPDVTLNRITGVEYRVDGGVWQPATASDGAFDGGTEPYSFTTATLSLGWHTIEVRGADSSGGVTALPYPSDPLKVQIFSDVPDDYWAVREIIACYNAGIVTGYTDGTYRPGNSVLRDQMAVYISRAIAGSDGEVPPGPPVASFADVPNTGYGADGTQPYWAYKYIEYLKANNVVTGYAGGYHPTDKVNRGQMSAFVARSIVTPLGDAGLAGYPLPPTPTFTDVPTTFAYYKYIEYIADPARDITRGYGDGLYHPERICSRAMMAVYVQRAFGLAM